MTDQDLDAALLRLRAVVLGKLDRLSDHVPEEDHPVVETPSASTEADSLGAGEPEIQVRSRWKSFIRWFRRE